MAKRDYDNWLISLEADNFSSFIKVWFAYLATIHEIILKSVNAEEKKQLLKEMRGDGDFLKKYKESHFPHISISESTKLSIIECYKASEICLNEMGAVWAYDSKVRLYLLPDTNFNSIGWLCDTRKANQITDTVALDLLYKEMHEYYSLPDNFINWSQQREIFINR